MKATLENFWKLDDMIQDLQSKINVLYNGSWNQSKSIEEDKLNDLIDGLVKQRNSMYSELDNADAYLHSQHN